MASAASDRDLPIIRRTGRRSWRVPRKGFKLSICGPQYQSKSMCGRPVSLFQKQIQNQAPLQLAAPVSWKSHPSALQLPWLPQAGWWAAGGFSEFLFSHCDVCFVSLEKVAKSSVSISGT